MVIVTMLVIMRDKLDLTIPAELEHIKPAQLEVIILVGVVQLEAGISMPDNPNTGMMEGSLERDISINHKLDKLVSAQRVLGIGMLIIISPGEFKT
jgi:hypothetical protein